MQGFRVWGVGGLPPQYRSIKWKRTWEIKWELGFIWGLHDFPLVCMKWRNGKGHEHYYSTLFRDIYMYVIYVYIETTNSNTNRNNFTIVLLAIKILCGSILTRGKSLAFKACIQGSHTFGAFLMAYQ